MVQVRGCSGALLSPHTAMTAAHCWGKEVTGCGNPYEPEQSATAGAELTGKYVYVPPVGSFEFDHPNTVEYGIAAFRTMPSWTTPFGTTCCPNGPAGCEFCGNGSGGAPSMFEQGTQAHKHHDITMVFVERPIEDVTPDKIILETNGTLPASMGGYDFDPVDLEGTTAVIAGASWSTQSPSSYTRVYGPREIQTVETPGGLSPVIVVDSELDCDLNTPTTEDYDGVGATLFFNPATTGEACTRGGDSGGPTYLNAPNLGGDDLTALFGAGAGRLIGGNHSAGQDLVGENEEPTHTCADIGTSRDTTTWNLLYEHEGQIVLGQNGDFIRKAMEDFDLDGFPNETDNCPYTEQKNDDNCNEIAEAAKGFPERGDACDPVPCAHGRVQPAKLTNVQTQGGPLIQVVTGTMIRDQFEVDAVPSHHYFSGASNGKLLEPLTVDDVPTLYRYCKNDGPLEVVCDESTVDSFFADLADGVISDERPFLRAHVKRPNVIETAWNEEELDYGSSPKKKLEWQYESDHDEWLDLSNQWVSPGALSGRLWLHSDTTVGQYAAGSPTGYRVNESGTTTGEDDLPNHYVPLAPVQVYNQSWLGAWNPWPYFPWKDDWGVYGPAWDGLMQEASTIIKGHEGKLARITRGAKAVVIDDHLTSGLKTLMGQSVLWEPAAEANLGQAHRGPTKSPHAIAFKADGTDVQDGAWRVGALRGTTSDASEPSLLKSGGPSARTLFSTVYSRADDLAFVVGGRWGSTPTREIWFRGVEGDIPWTRIPLGVHTSYEPQHVRAATWSFREQMLWVLDHDGAGTARLARVHPFTGFASVVHEWDWTGEWDKHWMQLAPNGDVVMFASTPEHTDHAVARFSVPPMVARAKVTVSSLLIGNGVLLYRPTIDPRGYSRIVQVMGRTSVLRSEEITGAAADLVDLQAML